MDRTQAYQRCLEKLIWATDNLKLEIQPSQLADIAELIVQPMIGPWRFFHTLQHIFEVGGNEDAIEVLAALFHDIVYVQVDSSINFNLSYYIAPFSKELKGYLVIREADELPTDTIFEMVASVFDFVPGQFLDPFSGQNEFLSALVAAKVLEPFFPPQLLLQIVACIEATIPFRFLSEDGLTASDRLYERLQVINSQLNLELADEEIVETVKKSVRVSNRDVGSFAHPSAANFLSNTWNLLPETNHNLTACSAYTVIDYRIAMYKIEGFMNSLVPEIVFRQFQGEPGDRPYEILVSRATCNIEIARLYLECKLVTIALIEALSFAVGLDIPLATMMGELPLRGFSFMRLESFLPTIINPFQPRNDLEVEVLNLLEDGRAKSIDSDLENSPLATFIVKSIGFGAIADQCNQARKFFHGNISTEEFISGFPQALPDNVIRSLLKLFDGRKSAIRRCYTITSQSISKPHSN
jgi:hypothetical protein